mmetsp:Transcript_13299/g.41371  ORF Transcript_13299/g.41371 Transcript_13299/m.41371 type:complete len:547 (+) Transcript_13299:108-1748(+)
MVLDCGRRLARGGAALGDGLRPLRHLALPLQALRGGHALEHEAAEREARRLDEVRAVLTKVLQGNVHQLRQLLRRAEPAQRLQCLVPRLRLGVRGLGGRRVVARSRRDGGQPDDLPLVLLQRDVQHGAARGEHRRLGALHHHFADRDAEAAALRVVHPARHRRRGGEGVAHEVHVVLVAVDDPREHVQRARPRELVVVLDALRHREQRRHGGVRDVGRGRHQLRRSEHVLDDLPHVHVQQRHGGILRVGARDVDGLAKQEHRLPLHLDDALVRFHRREHGGDEVGRQVPLDDLRRDVAGDADDEHLHIGLVGEAARAREQQLAQVRPRPAPARRGVIIRSSRSRQRRDPEQRCEGGLAAVVLGHLLHRWDIDKDVDRHPPEEPRRVRVRHERLQHLQRREHHRRPAIRQHAQQRNQSFLLGAHAAVLLREARLVQGPVVEMIGVVLHTLDRRLAQPRARRLGRQPHPGQILRGRVVREPEVAARREEQLPRELPGAVEDVIGWDGLVRPQQLVARVACGHVGGVGRGALDRHTLHLDRGPIHGGPQ